MKVSVICPVYNGGVYLRPMLDSIVNQTLEDIEIILVDDGSTDGSREVCEEYAAKDSRITVVPSKRKGEKWAVDTGRELARGEYIIIVDDDDEMMPDALEKLYGAASGADAVKGTAVYVYPDKENRTNVVSHKSAFNWKEARPIDVARHFLQPPELWTILLRRDFQKNIELGDYIFNDTDFVFMLKYLARDFRYIPDDVYRWKIHPSASHSTDYPFNVFRVFDSLERFIKKQQGPIWTIFSVYKTLTYFGNEERQTPETMEMFLALARNDLAREDVMETMLSPEGREWYRQLMDTTSL